MKKERINWKKKKLVFKIEFGGGIWVKKYNKKSEILDDEKTHGP